MEDMPTDTTRSQGDHAPWLQPLQLHSPFLRERVYEPARGASQYTGLDGGPARAHRGLLRRYHRRLAYPVPAAWHGFLPANRRWADAPARPRPAGTRIEQTQNYFAQVEHAIRDIVGDNQIDTILDNIGLPYSGINIALSDTATVGPMDGEILISLNEKHTSTPAHIAKLRQELPRRFPQLTFFFQPADIVNQVLNFGQPAPSTSVLPARRIRKPTRWRSRFRAISAPFRASSTLTFSRCRMRRR